MKVTHTATYDASVADVYAMLTDPAFRRYAAAATGVLEADVTVEPSEGGHVVRIDQLQPTDVSGTYRLEGTEGGTTQSFSGEVKVKVPLIKDRLEKLMAQLFLEGRDKEQAAGAAWLSGAVR
jgi:hypothetical protein